MVESGFKLLIRIWIQQIHSDRTDPDHCQPDTGNPAFCMSLEKCLFFRIYKSLLALSSGSWFTTFISRDLWISWYSWKSYPIRIRLVKFDIRPDNWCIPQNTMIRSKRYRYLLRRILFVLQLCTVPVVFYMI